MAYITYQELINRYSVIATWNGSESIVNSDLIYYACVELDGRLASHFSVPFDGNPPTIKDISMDLAYCKALMNNSPTKGEACHDVIIKRIEGIKAGEELIYTGSGTVISPTGADGEVWSTNMDYHPVHSMLDQESEYTQIDSSYLDALEDERS